MELPPASEHQPSTVPCLLRRERFAVGLHRWRWPVLGIWTVHSFLLHWFVIGFVSWDGLTYRVAPVVELVQHGRFGLAKYDYFSFKGYVPFTELVNLPFVYLFGLRGVLVGAPLVVFPLCMTAIYLFVRELTGDKRAGVFGSLAYGAIPVVNQQPYSGYIDYLVCGLLALFLYSVVRLRTAPRSAASFFIVLGASALYTLSRTQSLYAVALLCPSLAYTLFCKRDRFRVRVVQRRALTITLAATTLGSVPAMVVQLIKYRLYGSPTYPYQFQIFGVRLGTGAPMKDLFVSCGLNEDTWAGFAGAFVDAWVWPRVWPPGGFFDSRHLGSGFVLWVAALLLPTFVRRASVAEKSLAVTCLVVSLLARDFWLPRYAYTLMILVVIIVARGMCEMVASRRGAPLFFVTTVILFAHYARPEFDVAMIPAYIGARLNVTGSSAFKAGDGAFDPYPDANAKFVIIGRTTDGFLLPLYGKSLTNEVVATVAVAELGENSRGLAHDPPAVLFVDDSDATKDCPRECALRNSWRCLAYRIP